MRWWSAIALGAVLAGCEVGPGSNGGGTGPDDALYVEKIEISPQNPSTASGETLVPVQFSAKVHWSTGETTENTRVSWQSSNQIAGTISQDGLFTPRQGNGGVTLVTASYLGKSASTALTVLYTQDIVVGDLSSSLPVQAEAATVTIDDSSVPEVLYPPDGVVVPRNIYRFEFQWNSVADRPLTILEIASPTTRTRVFTLSDRWAPDYDQWQAIAATNSGGSFTVSMRAAALAEDGSLTGDITAPSEPIDVTISRLDASGSVYFWAQVECRKPDGTIVDSPSCDENGIADNGIKRIDFAAGTVTSYWTHKTSEHNCVSCHTLSPGGDRLAVVYEYEPPYSGAPTEPTRLGVLEVGSSGTEPEEVLSYEAGVYSSRGVFTPDGRYLLAMLQGELALYDGRTAAYLNPVDLGFERVATPSFSPDGAELVFAVPTRFIDDTHFYEARIWTVPFDDGLFGEPEPLTPALEGYNQFYPVYSPDGEWIAYTQSESIDEHEGDSLMDSTADLYLIRRGGGTPLRLDNLNDAQVMVPGLPPGEVPQWGGSSPEPPPTLPPDFTPDPAHDPNARIANSWPGWGPLPDADLLWLTFSSKRGYGHYSPSGYSQIWVAAIDLEKAEAGIDPSSPPFWLPLQEPEGENHIPQWGRY